MNVDGSTLLPHVHRLGVLHLHYTSCTYVHVRVYTHAQTKDARCRKEARGEQAGRGGKVGAAASLEM